MRQSIVYMHQTPPTGITSTHDQKLIYLEQYSGLTLLDNYTAQMKVYTE